MTCVVCRRSTVSGQPHTGCAPYLAVAPFLMTDETRGKVDRTCYVPEIALAALLALLTLAVLYSVRP